MKIFTTDTIRAWDAATIEAGTPSIELMERAAEVLAEAVSCIIAEGDRIAILAGMGNNGGDGLAVSRLLRAAGVSDIDTYLILPVGKSLSEDAEKNATRVKDFIQVKEELQLPSSIEFDSYDLIIDGLFGSGLSRPLEGIWEECVSRLNASETPVISIDIPSGAYADELMDEQAAVVRSELVLSLQIPKRVFLFPESQRFMDDFLLLDIDLDPTFHEEQDCDWRFLQEEDVVMPIRSRFSHKGTYGKGLLLAGHRGMYGAALLSGGACLRSGIGSLVVHSASEAMPILQSGIPEAMFSADSAVDRVSQLPDSTGYSAIGCGPGLGKDPATIAALDDLLERIVCPLVLDADALNIIAEKGWQKRIPRGTVITPHPKEFERLFGPTADSFSAIDLQIEMASALEIIIVRKGAHTSIALPDGRIYFNSTGNAHMATAGMGDVLTGFILGLLAQGLSAEESALAGVFYHGMAADVALARREGGGILSGDVVEALACVM